MTSSHTSFRYRLLRQVVSRIEKRCPDRLPNSLDLLLLQAVWGNYGFMASLYYLKKIVETAHATKGPILECGSGLTTVIMGLLTKDRNVSIVALEHHDGWRQRVCAAVDTLGFDHVTILRAPLKDFGEYDWYHFDKTLLPKDIQLVVCDGPPGNIKGSRYGLVPEIDQHLAGQCTILLDDANRKNEKDVVQRWKLQHGFQFRLFGYFQQFAMVNRAVD